MDICASSLCFVLWLLCRCSRACLCNPFGIMNHPPFISMPGHPWMSSRISSPVEICFYLPAILIWCNPSAAVSSMFILIPGISPPFSMWFCHNNQWAMKRFSSGLYSILILYWWILSNMHWSLCDMVAAFLKIATSGLWYMMMLTSLAEQ